jgi:hypothetical protein
MNESEAKEPFVLKKALTYSLNPTHFEKILNVRRYNSEAS